jgi:hypothetical protein
MPPTTQPGISLENFHLLALRVPRSRVVAILGSEGYCQPVVGGVLAFWKDDGDNTISICYNENDEVCFGMYRYAEDEDEYLSEPVGLLETIRSWIAARLGL